MLIEKLMNRTSKRLIIFFGMVHFLCLTSCGYHFEPLPSFDDRVARQTVSVPFAEGDLDGCFTAELIKELSTSSKFFYQRCGADLILKIRLMDFDEENIGYRYYRNKENHLRRETIPVETRIYLTAEVSLIESLTGKLKLGPVKISSTTDFDHDFYSTKNNINVFSLGQLTDYDEALDAAKKPLHHHLAKKIIDFISDSW